MDERTFTFLLILAMAIFAPHYLLALGLIIGIPLGGMWLFCKLSSGRDEKRRQQEFKEIIASARNFRRVL